MKIGCRLYAIYQDVRIVVEFTIGDNEIMSDSEESIESNTNNGNATTKNSKAYIPNYLNLEYQEKSMLLVNCNITREGKGIGIVSTEIFFRLCEYNKEIVPWKDFLKITRLENMVKYDRLLIDKALDLLQVARLLVLRYKVISEKLEMQDILLCDQNSHQYYVAWITQLTILNSYKQNINDSILPFGYELIKLSHTIPTHMSINFLEIKDTYLLHFNHNESKSNIYYLKTQSEQLYFTEFSHISLVNLLIRYLFNVITLAHPEFFIQLQQLADLTADEFKIVLANGPSEYLYQQCQAICSRINELHYNNYPDFYSSTYALYYLLPPLLAHQSNKAQETQVIKQLHDKVLKHIMKQKVFKKMISMTISNALSQIFLKTTKK